SGGWDGAIRFWSLTGIKSGAELKTPESGVYALAISPDGRCLASCGPSRDIRAWKLAVYDGDGSGGILGKLQSAGEKIIGKSKK
ncbi:MAG TPA: hypothetical protein PLL10_09475, partial [Elusimicrobiales bacterium]|nr:hypothetical protein [Elusimicrobiales bacterium]